MSSPLHANDPAFPLTRAEITAVMNPSDFIGRCTHQVEEFIGSIDVGEANTETVSIKV